MIDRSGLVTWILLIAPACAVAEDSPIGPADLQGYRAALAAKPDPSAPLVRFRDLWDRPGEFAGKVVAVEGRVARSFRQAKVGEFPPLVEAWVVSPAGDPSCLVFPQSEARPCPEVGATARFSGTFLRRIKYHGGDVDRLAPLIVGPGPPTSTSTEVATTWGDGWAPGDWMMVGGGCLAFALILARRHLARPDPARRVVEPPPEFLDGKPDGGEDFHETW